MEFKYCPFCKGDLKDISKHVKECEKCGERFYKNPVPAVAVVIFNENKEILLVKRGEDPKKGMWALPGGFMEVEEDVVDAAKRETEEETGLKIDKLKLLDIATEGSKRYTTVLLVAYYSKIFSGKLKPGDDSVDVKFFSYKNMPEIAFLSHKKFINKFLEIVRW